MILIFFIFGTIISLLLTGVTFKGMMIYYHSLPNEQKQVAVNPTPKETGIPSLGRENGS